MAGLPEEGEVRVASVAVRARPSLAVLLLSGLVAIFFAVEFVGILRATGGSFIYTLDDPYIHLALSEQIRHGNYGINPGEPATPASSVLWPFLLVPTAGTPVHAATPLVLAFLATLASGWLLLRLLDLVSDGAAGRRPVVAAALAAVPLFILNWAGVAFTGMEHSAHITATLAVSVGLVQVAARRGLPWWLVAGLVVGPWLRYEGLAVTVAGVLVLLLWRRWLVAILALAGAVAPLIAFSLWAVSTGLDPLPSSVLLKSNLANGSGSVFAAVKSAVLVAIGNQVFTVLVAAVLAHLLISWRITALHVYALVVLGGHAVAGQFGWFNRYELYAYAAVVPVLVWFARRPLRAVVEARHPLRFVAAGAALAAGLAAPYVKGAAFIPAASRNIYVQQAQMARFVSDHWREPVAVNDIGLVAYDGGEYVLDLWGLASQDVREARATLDGTEWMAEMAAEHDVSLVMIYRSWFPEIPETWEPVAVLTLEVPKVTVGGRAVTFLATSAADVDRLRQELEAFARTLPSGAALTFVDGGP
jgi:hypothetical protein